MPIIVRTLSHIFVGRIVNGTKILFDRVQDFEILMEGVSLMHCSEFIDAVGACLVPTM